MPDAAWRGGLSLPADRTLVSASGVRDAWIATDVKSGQDAAARVAVAHAIDGRGRQAERLLADAGEPTAGDDEPSSSPAALARALAAVDRLDENAAALVAASDEYADDEFWAVRLLLRARWDHALGNYAGALEALSRARALHAVPPGSLADQIVHHVQVVTLTLMDLPEKARHERDADAARLPPLSAVAAVRHMLYVDEPSTALHASRQLIARDRLGPSFRAEGLLLAAWAHARVTGEIHVGHARTAGALIAQEGLWRVLGLVPAEVREQTAIRPPRAVAALVERTFVPQPDTSVHVTAREREVLRALAEGGSLPEIADRLNVSVNTVKTQVRSAYRRLGVTSRPEALAEASRRGFLAL